MSAATRVLSSISLRTGVLALATLAGAASALGMPDRDDHGRGRDHDRWGHDNFRSHDFGPRHGSGISISIGAPPIYYRSYSRPVIIERSCPTVYASPVYVSPVQRVYLDPPPVIYSTPTVYTTTPQQVVIQQPAPQVVVQQPAPQVVVQQPAPQVVTRPAEVIQQPTPQTQIQTQTIMASATIPAPAAATRVYRDVSPSDLNISAYRTNGTIVVLVTGTNTMEGYTTSLSVNDVQSDAPLILHNEPPVVTQNLKNSAFTVNASLQLAGNPASVGIKIAGKTYQVPVTEVPSLNSNGN